MATKKLTELVGPKLVEMLSPRFSEETKISPRINYNKVEIIQDENPVTTDDELLQPVLTRHKRCLLILLATTVTTGLISLVMGMIKRSDSYGAVHHNKKHSPSIRSNSNDTSSNDPAYMLRKKEDGLAFQAVIEMPHRIYPSWGNRDFPCNTDFIATKQQQQSTMHRQGMLYIKTPKAASSILAGIAMHLGERHTRDVNDVAKIACNVHAHEAEAAKLDYSQRDESKSFMWTFVGDPKTRALSSYFYYRVTMQNENPTGPRMMSYLKTRASDYQTNYIRTRDRSDYEMDKANETALAILQEYNFVGIAELLDESLVVLRLLMGLDAKDVLYLPAMHEMRSFAARDPEECGHIYPGFTTPAVGRYLESEEWRDYDNELDYALVSAARRSLQATIRSIGREKYRVALQEHRTLLNLAKRKCMTASVYPCSEEGVRQIGSCYWDDIGCGYDCIDAL